MARSQVPILDDEQVVATLGSRGVQTIAAHEQTRQEWNMLQLSVRYVHPDQVESLKDWFKQLETTRRPEALATLIDETVTHERAILITEGNRQILVYAMEVADPEQSRRSADSGKHPIDAEHRAITRPALAGTPTQAVILDLLVTDEAQ